MREIERIVDQLQRTFDGRAWHGPSMMQLLTEVDVKQALARPLQGRHTIWELVLHIAAWESKVQRVLKGERMSDLPDEEDWPLVRDTGDAAWKQALEELAQIHRSVITAASESDETKLDENVPGASYSFHTMLHGVVQHDVYHSGQIAILKKE